MKNQKLKTARQRTADELDERRADALAIGLIIFCVLCLLYEKLLN